MYYYEQSSSDEAVKIALKGDVVWVVIRIFLRGLPNYERQR